MITIFKYCQNIEQSLNNFFFKFSLFFVKKNVMQLAY